MEMLIDGKLIVLNAQQEAAVIDMLAWYNSDKKKEPYILQGYAGTGKTTLLKILIQAIGIQLSKIALVAPTNRAAKVLSNKTGMRTKTAFSLIYMSTKEELDWERSRLRMWEDSLSFAQLGVQLVEHAEEDLRKIYDEAYQGDPEAPDFEEFKKSRISIALQHEGVILPDDNAERQRLFEKLQPERIKLHRSAVTELLQQDIPVIKKNPEQLARDYSLFLCDEASMVSLGMGKDLVSCGIPTILVGDPFQLPPVKEKAYWDGKRANAVLTVIERQKGLGAGIPLAGQIIRNGGRLKGNESVSLYGRNSYTDEQWLSTDQILCGTHKTRERMCRYIRNLRNFTEVYPEQGEKIVAAYNQRELGIMNGELYTVLHSKLTKGGAVTELTLLDPYGKEIPKVLAWTKGFTGRNATSYLDDHFGKFWFGYAITCHQSQGSEWNHVTVCDDWPGGESHDRWIYTAITRASSHVDVIK